MRESKARLPVRVREEEVSHFTGGCLENIAKEESTQGSTSWGEGKGMAEQEGYREGAYDNGQWETKAPYKGRETKRGLHFGTETPEIPSRQ